MRILRASPSHIRGRLFTRQHPRHRNFIMTLNAAEQASEGRLPARSAAQLDARTRRLIEAPLTATLLRLAAPHVLVMLAQASVGLIQTYLVGKRGTAARAGVALLLPVVLLMQIMTAGARRGGTSSAFARTLGAGRRADANALSLHALAIAVILGLLFTPAVLAGGPRLYAGMGG